MHGQNKLRPAERRDDGKLQVHEVWRTIQGEGPFAGMPAVFIRLTGCNLACTFCDTKWDDERDKYMDVQDILTLVDLCACNEIGHRACKLVVLTGGEPMRQDLSKLVPLLLEDGFQVQIETAGTYWQDWIALYDSDVVDSKLTLVCSPKTKHVHPMIQARCDHWKYVIQFDHQSIYDGLPAGGTQFIPEETVARTIAPDLYEEGSELQRQVTCGIKFGDPARVPRTRLPYVTIWLSPCDDGDPERNQHNMQAVAQAVMKYGYRATLQMHKILGMP